MSKPVFVRGFILAAALNALIIPQSASATYNSTILADNPIGYWQLNETSGTTALDSSGNNRNGTYVGGATLGTAMSIPAGGLSAAFNGLNQWISLPGTWGGGSNYTLEAWARVAGVSEDFQAIVSATNLEFFHFQISSKPTELGYWNTLYSSEGGGVLMPIIPESPIHVWRHLVVVGSPGASAVYVDGTLFGTALVEENFSTVSPTSSLRIASGYGEERFFNGNLQNVAIYDHALTPQQIHAHHMAGIVPEPEIYVMLLAGLGLMGLLSRCCKTAQVEPDPEPFNKISRLALHILPQESAALVTP